MYIMHAIPFRVETLSQVLSLLLTDMTSEKDRLSNGPYRLPRLHEKDVPMATTNIMLPDVVPIDIEGAKIDCSSLFIVPATSAAQNRLLFFFFCCGRLQY